MKKLIFILLCIRSLVSAGTYTPNYHLYKPAIGDEDYVTPFSAGMDTIDTALLSAATNVIGLGVLKVNRSGDIMTGDLIVNATVQSHRFVVFDTSFPKLRFEVAPGIEPDANLYFSLINLSTVSQNYGMKFQTTNQFAYNPWIALQSASTISFTVGGNIKAIDIGNSGYVNMISSLNVQGGYHGDGSAMVGISSPTSAIALSTGTIAQLEAEDRLKIINLTADTTTIRQDLNAVIASTSALANVITSTEAIVSSIGIIQNSLNSVILSTGGIQSSLNGVIASTGAINADLQAYKSIVQSSTNTLAISTGGIYSALNSTAVALTAEISRAMLRENDIGVSTGTIQDSLNDVINSTGQLQIDLAIEISDRGLADDAIKVSTGINTADILSLKLSTGGIQTSLNAVIISTGELKALIDAIPAATITSTSVIVNRLDGIDVNISTAAHYNSTGTWTARQDFQTITTTSTCIGGDCRTAWPVIVITSTETIVNRLGAVESFASTATTRLDNLDKSTQAINLALSTAVYTTQTYDNPAWLTGLIPSTATGSYQLRVATATYLATAPGACSAGQYISGMTADGTKTCGTPSGAGDVVLASTQTFTGINTFSKTITANQGISASTSVIGGNTFDGNFVSTGNVTATGVISASSFKTLSGTTGNINSGVATTIYTVSVGLYEVFANVGYVGSAFIASATVVGEGTAARIVTNNGASLSITISGQDIQVTQTSGDPQNVAWSILKIL